MKPIKGFENYTIDINGNVYNVKRRKYKKQTLQTSNYYQVGLSKNGKIYSFLTHRLVALHFIENINNLPCVNHINGIKTDNRVENLEWITYSDNHKHAYMLGLKKPNHIMKSSKKVKDLKTNIIYDSVTKLAISIGMKKQDLINRLNGRTKNQTTFVYV